MSIALILALSTAPQATFEGVQPYKMSAQSHEMTMKLYLNKKGDTRIEMTGAGLPGMPPIIVRSKSSQKIQPSGIASGHPESSKMK